MSPRRLAVVDVGSNSLRLFLVDELGPDGPEGERAVTIVGLRRGADQDGNLAPEAVDRLDGALRDFAGRLERFAPDAVAAVGTSAVRDAPNAHLVLDAVAQRLGAPLQVVTGEQEAKLAFAGARLGAPEDEDCVLVDIGGGSTELVRGGSGGVESAVSLQVGAVRQTEAFLRSDPPSVDELSALRASVAEEVRPVAAGGPSLPLVGVAGTITTLAAIEVGGYDRDRVHGHRLTANAVERMLSELAAMPVAERERVPGLEPARAPVIVAGAAIAAEVLRAFGAPALTVSERDILDGIAVAALGAPTETSVVTTPRPR